MNTEAEVWLTRKEAAGYLGLSVSALAHMACKGVGPRYYRAGKLTRYRLGDLNAWAGHMQVATLPGAIQARMRGQWRAY